jgi:hypothetical protein
MKMLFKGTSGIEKPVDFDGNEIEVGDTLSFDYLDKDLTEEKSERYKGKAIFIVKAHHSGKGLYAEGIKLSLYLHDFRFKFCRIITKSGQRA